MISNLSAAAPRIVGAILVGACLAAAVPTNAVAGETGVGVGMLSCESVPNTGLNLIVHSTVDIKCVFEAGDGSVERYKGETGIGFGIDLDLSHEETFHFAVLAAKFKSGTHQLSGSYAGGKASASLGIGAGGQLLIGGLQHHIGLKPTAIKGEGVGVAAGLSYLYLEPDTDKAAKASKL